MPINTSEVSFYQTENTLLTQSQDVGFAARAPPLAVTNVAITGGVTSMQGSAFALYGQETVAALFGFSDDLDAPNRADDILPDTVYRGDARAPDEIFDQGFQPKDPNANVDLEEYVNTTPSPDSQYMSTTSDPDVPTDFATQYGTQNGIDIDNRLGNSALHDEAEIVIPDGSGVSDCSIRGCQPVNPDGSPSAPYIPNPNYTGGN
jgi:hypothetical protein